MYKFLSVLAIISTLVAADPQWTIDKTTTATMVVGVGASSDKFAVAAAASNGVGDFVEQFDGGVWTKHSVSSALILDATVTKAGVVAVASLSKILVSYDQGNTYTGVPGIVGVSQSANKYGDTVQNLALVGSWESKDATTNKPISANGVAYSVDGGVSFQLSSSVPVGYVRYGAFPTEKTWFISSGIWGSDPAASAGKGFELSARLKVDEYGRRLDVHAIENQHHSHLLKPSADNTTGWFGAVSKTTDGGQTWQTVFTTNLETDYLYFNNIDCLSETNCVVVGEGNDATGAYLVKAFSTFDGGNTWTNTFTSNDVSLMAVKFHTPEEGWIATTSKSGRNLTGNFYRTTDGGKTWTLVQSLANCYPVDLDFGETIGFAVCLSSSGSTASVALYK